jgi:lipid-binding SYLF domain-containing protein
LRTFLAILIGTIAAIAVQTIGDLGGSLAYPAAVTDMWDRAQVAQVLAGRPTGALLISAAGYLLGGFVGAFVGKWISRTTPGTWTPPALLALMALAIGWNFPGPLLGMVATVLAPLVGAMLASRLVGERPAPAAEEVAVAQDD